jgi:hypothetical protein
MSDFDELNSPLFPVNAKDWITTGEAFEGISIFGGTGSGKTSGSGRTIALSILRKGWGGIVLTVKPDERNRWINYVSEANRANDLLIVDSKCENTIDLLGYEYENHHNELTFTSEITNVLTSAMNVGLENRYSGDPFWDEAIFRLLANAIDLAIFSLKCEEKLRLEDVVEIIRSAPCSTEDGRKCQNYLIDYENSKSKPSKHPCLKFMDFLEKAHFNERLYYNEKTTPKDEKFFIQARGQDYNETFHYWTGEYPSYDSRLQSSIIAVLMSRLSGLLRSPYKQLFTLGTNIRPEDTFGGVRETGKIILLDIPVKKYMETGRFAQILFKQIWQRAVESGKKRDIKKQKPVFLWADEAQFFVTKHDMLFQQTARASQAATVYLTQSVANYKAALGDKGDNNSLNITDSLMGNFQTMFFHSNGCTVTNKYAQEVFGEKIMKMRNINIGVEGIQGGLQNSYYPILPANIFTRLKKGGKKNGCRVEGYVFQAGKKWVTKPDDNYVPCEFDQNISFSEIGKILETFENVQIRY